MTNYEYYKQEAISYLANVQTAVRHFRYQTGYEGELRGQEFEDWLKAEHIKIFELSQFEFELLKKAQEREFFWVGKRADGTIYFISHFTDEQAAGICTTFFKDIFSFVHPGDQLNIDSILTNYKIIKEEDRQ